MTMRIVAPMVLLLPVVVLLLLPAANGQLVTLVCPNTIGKGAPFNLTVPTTISIDKTNGAGSLCTLTLELDNGIFIPIARSYDGYDWERAGGSFIATSPEWVCSGSTCTSIIPPGNNYVVATRSVSITPIATAEIARFLESASFGATPSDLANWGDKSFAQYIKDQVNTPMTSHRELFRKMANPRWTFNKPEFAGRLDPCAPNSTWRRQVLTNKDRRKLLNIGRVNDRWEVKIDGHVRTMVRQLRFINAVKGQNDTVANGGIYEFCSTDEEIFRGIYKAKIGGSCRQLVSEDLIVDFPDGYMPANAVRGSIPALVQNPLWKSISSRNPEYMLTTSITTSSGDQSTPAASIWSSVLPSKILGGLFCRPFFLFVFRGLFCRNNNNPPSVPPPSGVVPASPTAPSAPISVSSPSMPQPTATIPIRSPVAPTSTVEPTPPKSVPVTVPAPIPQSSPTLSQPTSSAPIISPIAPVSGPTQTVSCQLVLSSSAINAPLFAKTADGIWLQSDPRIDMKSNTVDEPLPDGGFGLLQGNKTLFCSNAARTVFNEGKCKMSKVPACFAGSISKSASMIGAIVCGSPGEISNDLTSGDSWLDVSSISSDQSIALGLPADTTNNELFGRQREFIWSEISLKANDQLRQRIAFALLYIFSLPKMSIRGEGESTELFLFYYDIFVRNSFGNYGDILEEISYNALNAESLSYVGSRSVAFSFASTNTVVYPDENYARELMQLFTIGLFELNMDGTPVFNVNGTVQSYTSEDVLSFSKIWTAFIRNLKRANVESFQNDNRYDPMRLEAERRDRFPKSDLSEGYIGDLYPLCIDLPSKSFLRVGAKYRLLGSSPRTELKARKWPVTQGTQNLLLASGSTLYDRLCKPEQNGLCLYPSLVVLDGNLECSGLECSMDTIHFVQVGAVFYEYIRQPCVELPFYMNGVKTAGQSRNTNTICANPSLPVASEACCLQNQASNRDAIRSCLISGETMTRDRAQSRCSSIGRTLCDFRSVNATEKCPFTGFHWTSLSCSINVKVSRSGELAIVHNSLSAINALKKNSPNYFKVYWESNQYPSVDNFCEGGECEIYENTCFCNITVTEEPVFLTTPTNAAEVLEKLRIGHPDPSMFDLDAYSSTSTSDFKTYSTSQTCCGTDTFFEVQDRNGQTRFLRNLKSTVRISGSTFKFRNPPQFNSVFSTEYSIADAHFETKAALDYLLYHQNTPPFVAYRFLQRFGVSNPTPRSVLAVATAFKTGRYTNEGITFGGGKYGDMEATIAAVLLDREARSVVLDKDPAHGALREPILKVLSFMRATDFKSSVPLVELDFMDVKAGQMAYEQGSVFSFFRPEYSPSELASTGLSAPEAQAMSSTNIVGTLNGLYSLVKYGLNECNGGFGAFGGCTSVTNSGSLTYVPSNVNVPSDMVRDLSYLLTGGRMSETKQQTIVAAIAGQSTVTSRYQMALQLIASSSEFHSTNAMNSLQPSNKTPAPTTATPPTNGYKAIIHFFLRGGCDSFNVLVPANSCDKLHEEYVSTRGVIGLTPAETIPLSGDAGGAQPCSSFTVHSGLSTIQKLYDEQDLLFMANVGVLTQYVNRSDYSFRTATPLFSHNSMQDEVAKLDPLKNVGGTGALGRMTDVLQMKGYRTSRTAIDSPSANLASRSASTPPIVTMSSRGVSTFNLDPLSPTMRSVVVDQLNSGASGLYGDLWSTLLKRSINQTDELFTTLKNTPTKTIFPSTALGNRFKIAAQLIAARESRGVDRDVFFIPFDGFDTHDEVTETLQLRFAELNDALKTFVNELKMLGMWDNVTIVQTSDFGRTITGNSGGGTDHGWGGNYWLAGGAVRGQRIVGQYPPTFLLDAYEYNIDRGRIIPTTSWDSIFNSIAAWMGIDNESDLRKVLPNRYRFPDVFPASTLFSI